MTRSYGRSNDVCGHLELEHYAKGKCRKCYSKDPERIAQRKAYLNTEAGRKSVAKYRSKPEVVKQREAYRAKPIARAKKLVRSALSSNNERRERGRLMSDVEIDADWVLAQFERQGGKCYWSGVPLEWVTTPARGPWQVSLDRLNSNLGYTKQNTVLAAWCMNAFRGLMSEDETRDALRRLTESLNKLG